MATVQAGDVIFDEQGQPTNILHTTDVTYGHACYDVSFSDGSTITADAEHLWETSDYGARKAAGRSLNPVNKPKIRTTKDIAATLK